MCGIAGIVPFFQNVSPRMDQLQAMCDAMVYRGPDEEGTDIRDNVALGMRRLSIIDLAGGSQPIFNEDGSILCVFNGEIYNYRELREDLEDRGHRFRSCSDTEVIVHAYEEFGEDFPTHLNGMFSIALHDTRRKRVLLARDHLGIKPLYWTRIDQGVVFGSEIKVILASNLVEKQLDLDNLGQFLAWEYVPGPGTLLRNIEKLPAGHILCIDRQSEKIQVRQYWDIPESIPCKLTAQEWEERVDQLLATCVRRQLVSDVPLGAFLSGGVDSSLVVSAMGKATTFSIGFDDPSYNELGWARRVADHLGVNHLDEVLSPDIYELFFHLLTHMDDPIGDFSIFPTYLVSKCARQQVTVALSGDGGDELFGGYETFVANDKARVYQKIPTVVRKGMIEPLLASIPPRKSKKGLINKAKRFAEGAGYHPALGHCRWRLFLDELRRKFLFTPEAEAQITTPVGHHIRELFAKASDRDPLNQCLYVDTKSYLCDNILTKVDRMSMAVSLETRVPFLDPELVSLAFSIPANLKVEGNTTKVLLKRVAARHIPKSCVYRPKEGFSIPIKQWLGTTLRPLIDQYLDQKRIDEQGIFNYSAIESMIDNHLLGRENNSHQLWSLIMFEAWYDRWLR